MGHRVTLIPGDGTGPETIRENGVALKGPITTPADALIDKLEVFVTS